MGDFLDWLGGASNKHRHSDNDRGRQEWLKKRKKEVRRNEAMRIKKQKAAEVQRVKKKNSWWDF